MRRLLGTFRRPEGERGQVLVLFAVGFVAFCGLVAMAVDAGLLLYTKTDLQKVADSAVFAGVQDLPNASSASGVANEYVGRNADSSTSAVIEVSQHYSPNDTITVTATRHVNYTFLRLLGVDGADVSARASARIARYRGGSNIVPFALVASNDPNSTLFQNDCYLGNDAWGLPIFKQNTLCQLKGGANSTSGGGDFGALAIEATGADTFRESVADGTDGSYVIGDQVIPQTGNMTGPTTQGLGDRLLDPPPPGCPSNDRSDVLRTLSDGTVVVNEACAESSRIIIIPVVNQINNPEPSTILGFAFMFITSVTGSGGNTQVWGEYVTFTSMVPGGAYQGLDGSGPIVARMVE
ncbi:MAG TPA: TadE/TadG family type IV pilus assembly protein [Tepidiformaceae bacterium]